MVPENDWPDRWFRAVEQVVATFPTSPPPNADEVARKLSDAFPELLNETRDLLAGETLLNFVRAHLAAGRVDRTRGAPIAFRVGGQCFRYNFAVKSTRERISWEEYQRITGERKEG